uniref:HAT C-terminal dimerisation domain-containing protein n=1 Tax=Amphiprion percula TaxID=161767 RepID=A0A3P8U9K1_AMPPE
MSSVKRKLCDEHRTFQQSWEEEFAFVEVNNKPVCLLCQKQFIPKRTNLQKRQNMQSHWKSLWSTNCFEIHVECSKDRQISKLQLSDSTLSRHVENILDDLFIKLIDDLKKTQNFNLAIDESTDVSDTVQLMIWARFFNGDTFMEEMLALLPLTGQTRGEDICLVLTDFFQGPGREIDLGKLVSITTDGAPSMVGKERGLVALMRKEDLCCKLKGGELKTTMGKVVKVVNYIRGDALKHRQFRTLVEEYNTQYEDLMLHAAVRWMSRGIVLEKLVDLLMKFALEAAFLVDTTKHLNSLNLKLQGNNKLLPALVNDVSAFMEKLCLYQDHGDNDFTHFPNLRSQVSQLHSVSFEPAVCVQYLDELASEFSSRFNDLWAIMPMIKMVENPYNADVRDVSQHCEMFGVSKENFEEELIELRNNQALKQKHLDESMVIFWMQSVPTAYSTIILCAKKILTCFGSTYVCESGFSTMGVIKSKQHNSLSDHNDGEHNYTKSELDLYLALRRYHF